MATVNSRLRITLACVFSLLAMVCMCVVLAGPAHAEVRTLVAPQSVTDDATKFEVSKLNASNHKYVKGATLVIYEEDNHGKIVDQWTTTDKPHLTKQVLDVDKVYVLHEISAPDGYKVAKDVRFRVEASEELGVTILSGEDAEQMGAYSIALYDTKVKVKTVKDVKKNVITAPKTGDDTPFILVLAIGICSLIGIAVLQVLKPRKRDEELG